MSKYKNTKSFKFNKENSKYLLIVESPSKCSKIESYLGSLYKCISSKGHLRQLKSYKKYDIQYEIMKDKISHVKEMKKIIDQYDKENIILASDDDREGEAIAWHICEIFDLDVNTTQRIIFNEITRNALQESVKKPQRVNMNLVQSQIARQVLDVIIGYKISPFLWKYAYNDKNNSLSAGRCQTPALRLIYDNYIEKNDKSLEKTYKVLGNFSSRNIDFKLNKTFDKVNDVEDFLNESKTFDYTLEIGSLKKTQRKPCSPLNTAYLLQICNSTLHLSPKDTMSLAQILYQDGLITYMRTENKKYSEDFIKQGTSYIQSKYGEKYIGNTESLKTKGQNPHEAIRVTNIEKTSISKNGKINSLYNLIYKYTIESMMSESIYDVYDVKIYAPKDTYYKYTIEIPVFLGFNIVKEKSLDKMQNECNGMYHFFKCMKEIKHNKITCEEQYTQVHSHYNESSLINTLEKLEIGRPSTYATFVDTIIQRNYVKKMDIEGVTKESCKITLINNDIIFEKTEKIIGNEKQKLVIQPIGILVMEFLLQNFEELFSYVYTKHMEEKLDTILNDASNWQEICKECEEKIKIMSKSLKNLTKEVYNIDDNHVFMFSKNGAVLKTKDCEPIFKSVKKMKIDLDKLKAGAYKLHDLLETDKYICMYENEPLYLKNGKYGHYLSWGENKKSVKIKKPMDNITFDDIKYVLDESTNSTTNIMRELNENLSIRKGKYGLYVYYKTKTMVKPQFLNTKKFAESLLYCEKEVLYSWLEEKYNINI